MDHSDELRAVREKANILQMIVDRQDRENTELRRENEMLRHKVESMQVTIMELHDLIERRRKGGPNLDTGVM